MRRLALAAVLTVAALAASTGTAAPARATTPALTLRGGVGRLTAAARPIHLDVKGTMPCA